MAATTAYTPLGVQNTIPQRMDSARALEELRKSINIATTESNPFEDANIIEEEEEEEQPQHQRFDDDSPIQTQRPVSMRPTSRINLLTPPKSSNPDAPLIICLHGSNDSCMRSWLSMIETLYKSGNRVLLYDRPTPNVNAGNGADLKPHRAVSELCSYLYSQELHGPFVIIAHSYGGCIARLFLQQKPKEVAGMVLVETGQETALAAKVEEEQYRKQILGNAPLSVIRGNTLKRKQDEFDKAWTIARSEAQREQLRPQRMMLDRWEIEDKELKQKQLQLSRRSKFVQVQDVGHHVIRDRPDAVVQEVRWVFQEIRAKGVTVGDKPMNHGNTPAMGIGSGGLTRSVSKASAGLMRKASEAGNKPSISTSGGGSLRRGFSTRMRRTFTRKGRATG